MALNSKGMIVYMQSSLASAKTITGASTGSPGAGEVQVTSATHGYSAGDIIKITGVVGMQEINKRAFVVSTSPATNTFRLKGTVAAGYTAYSSGGSAYKATMTAIGEVSGIPEMGGTEPNSIDVSHLLSVAAETLSGLPGQSPVSFDIWYDLNTNGHVTLQTYNQTLEDVVFRFYKPNSFNLTLVAQVAGVRVTAGDVNSAIKATVSLLPRAAGAWSLDP